MVLPSHSHGSVVSRVANRAYTRLLVLAGRASAFASAAFMTSDPSTIALAVRSLWALISPCRNMRPAQQSITEGDHGLREVGAMQSNQIPSMPHMAMHQATKKHTDIGRRAHVCSGPPCILHCIGMPATNQKRCMCTVQPCSVAMLI